jgi:hypothetical protein
MAGVVHIENKRDSLVVLPPVKKAKGKAHGAVRLLPGVNVIEADYLDAIKGRSDIKQMLGPDGILAVVNGGTPILPAGSKDSLAGLKTDDAIALLVGCDGLDQLARWAASEKRKTVIEALVAQIAKVEAAAAESANTEGGTQAA